MATKITTRVLADNAVTDAKIADVTLTTATQSSSDNTTKIATTAYVTTAIANLADSAPSTLNTLNELAAALGDDANYATTTTNAIAAKLPLAGGTLSGALTASAGLTVAGSSLLYFRDAQIYIRSSADGDLNIVADDEIDLTSTLIDINGNADISGTLGVTGALTGTSFNDGYVTWSGAQFNRYGAAIELQFTPTNTATLVKTVSYTHLTLPTNREV